MIALLNTELEVTQTVPVIAKTHSICSVHSFTKEPTTTKRKLHNKPPCIKPFQAALLQVSNSERTLCRQRVTYEVVKRIHTSRSNGFRNNFSTEY